jgi:uncharacterized BrkB/YihY/UPF0761 family membrane protein
MNFHPFNGVVNNPKSLSTLTAESMVIGLFAIFLGTVIDKIFKNISDKVNRFKILISIIQILVSAVITALIYLYGPSEFSMHFQTSLPGMLFPALFYGVQSNIYSAWQQN